MKLIIFPGLGDPFHNSYEEVYKIIKAEATKRKISEVKIVNYPGHLSFNKEKNINATISFTDTINVIEDEIISAENSKSNYRVLCRSYSTLLFLIFLAERKPKIKFIEKVVLWGGPDCEEITKSFLDDIKSNILEGKKKGVFFDKNSISYKERAEDLINTININFPIYISSGENDSFFGDDCYNKLKKINKNPNIFFPSLIKNEKHAVRQPNNEYFSLIFD